MFEINDWSDVDDTADTNIGNFGNANTCKKSKKKRKKQANELKTKSKLSVPNLNDKTKIAVTNLVTSKFKDRFLNSPTLTTSLVDNDDTQQNNKLKTTKEMVRRLSFKNNGSENIKVENILNKGLKFASESQFLNFINHQPKKRKKSKKNESTNKKPKFDQPKSVQENETTNSSKSAEENSKVKSNINSDRFNLKKNDNNKLTTHTGFNVDKLSELLKNTSNQNSAKDHEKTSTSMHSEDSDAKRKLKSSRFRFLNEKLYTQSGQESYKMFKNDTEGLNTFKTYHEGYAEQVRKWPIDPLDLIISSIMKRNCEKLVIADFGCGEARLAQALSSSCKQIHSFDLVALNDKITVCDFSKTPLENESIDIAVFCLSLMGTNLRDYIKEANRVLKMGGALKIAEVESRFEGDLGVQEFIESIEKTGFGLKWKDLKKEYFNLFDFKKNKNFNKKKAQNFELKPCIYKKR